MRAANMPTSVIRGFHAHVYFSQATLEQGRALCEAAAREFDLVMGRVHEKPVGPHPNGVASLRFGQQYSANWCHGWP